MVVPPFRHKAIGPSSGRKGSVELQRPISDQGEVRHEFVKLVTSGRRDRAAAEERMDESSPRTSPSGSCCHLPRTALIVTALPNKVSAAVAPSATISFGRTRRSSWRNHQRHASTSPASGFLCNRNFPRGSFLKCLTALVTYSRWRGRLAAAMGLIEDSSCRSSKGSACQIFLVARLLAHEHHQSGGRTLTPDTLGRVTPKIAPAATIETGLETSERSERGGGVFYCPWRPLRPRNGAGPRPVPSSLRCGWRWLPPKRRPPFRAMPPAA